MDFKHLEAYLSGEKFLEDLEVDLSVGLHRISRVNKILKEVKGKNVIHVGCVDHIPLIDSKIRNNEWVHKLITDHTTKCIGIDTNAEGIEYIQSKYNYKNVVCADLLTDTISELNDISWDLMVLGEILEHVDNPVSFLQQIRERYSSVVRQIIITVPNAFSHIQQKKLANNIEMINSDHRYYFSPYTLAKILFLAGFSLDEVSFADPYYLFSDKVINKLAGKKIISRNICLSSTLIGIASFK
jgi:hypothetical protein